MDGVKTTRRKVAVEWTEATVLDALEALYQDRSKGTFLRGVRDATSFNARRTADGMYMGAWESVGIQLHGFEIKVSRSDWLREIQDLSKAGQFEKFCHYWWVAAPDGLVKMEEMPSQWGLKIVSKNESGYKVRTAKAATINRDAKLDYDFFSSCLRQCRRTDPIQNDVDRKVSDAYDKGLKAGLASNHNEQTLKRIQNKVDEYLRKIDAFENAAGVRIDQWGHTPAQIGQAVRFVIDHGEDQMQQLQLVLNVVDRIKRDIEAVIPKTENNSKTNS